MPGLVPGIHAPGTKCPGARLETQTTSKTWMAGTSTAMTAWTSQRKRPLVSDLDRICEQHITPFIQGPHKVGFGMDCSTLTIAPFSSIGIEGKMPHVVLAGLFPMLDRQRLAIVLAIEIGSHPFYAARLSRMVLREDDLQPVPPQHQNVSPFRAEETTKAQQFAIGSIGCMIARGHIRVEQLNPDTVAIVGMRSSHESA